MHRFLHLPPPLHAEYKRIRRRERGRAAGENPAAAAPCGFGSVRYYCYYHLLVQATNPRNIYVHQLFVARVENENFIIRKLWGLMIYRGVLKGIFRPAFVWSGFFVSDTYGSFIFLFLWRGHNGEDYLRSFWELMNFKIRFECRVVLWSSEARWSRNLFEVFCI